MVRLAKEQTKSQNNIPEATITARSKFVIPLMRKGVMLALTQYEEYVEEIAAYYISDGYFRIFFNAATTEVANSGNEVPPATKVNPIIDSLTPRFRAMPLAPSTNHCPPNMSPHNPPTMYKTDFHTGNVLISSVSSLFSAFVGSNGKRIAKKITKKQSNNKPSVMLSVFASALSNNISLAQ